MSSEGGPNCTGQFDGANSRRRACDANADDYQTSSQQEPDQVVYLYTVAREAGLWYVVLAAPPSRLGGFGPSLDRSLRPCSSELKHPRTQSDANRCGTSPAALMPLIDQHPKNGPWTSLDVAARRCGLEVWLPECGPNRPQAHLFARRAGGDDWRVRQCGPVLQKFGYFAPGSDGASANASVESRTHGLGRNADVGRL